MTLLAFERRWAHSVLEAFAPDGGEGLVPRAGEVDFTGVLERMLRGSTRRAALGLRLALWMVALAPVWMWGTLTSAARLHIGDRARLVSTMLAHRSYVVRELTTLLKIAASFAMLGTASVRARSGYDRGARHLDEPGEVERSGERLKLRVLPVAAAAGKVG